MKKIVLFFGWYPLAFLTLSLALTSLLISTFPSSNAKSVSQNQPTNYYENLPSVLGSFTTTVYAADARPQLIKNYLDKYKSPLAPYADFIVQTSDKYNLDYRLMVAIAQCESNVCKIIPHGSYNCWGFGNAKTKFTSWEHALEYVAQTLKENYMDEGLTTPELMMPKYVPPSVEKGGPWAKCVNQFLNEIE